MTRWLTFGLVAAALALAVDPAQAQIKLRYQFKEGQKRDYVMDQKMQVKMNLNGMDIEMKVDQVMEMTWDIKKVDAQGNAVAEVKLGRAKMSVDGFTGTVEVDSADDQEPKDAIGKVLGQVVKSLAGAKMTVSITPTGEVKDVKLSEETAKKLRDLPAADGAGGFGNLSSEGGLKAMAQGGLTFPTEPVTKGKTWTESKTIELPMGKVVTEMKYTYEGQVERDCRKLEKIAFVPELKLQPEADAPLQFKMTSKEGKGRVLFDNQSGKLVEQTTDLVLEVVVEVNGMTINQHIVQRSTVRPKEASKK